MRRTGPDYKAIGAAALTVSVLTAALLGGTRDMRSTERPGQQHDPPPVEIWMLGPVSKLRGHTWPRDGQGQPRDLEAIQTDCALTLHLPSGREYTAHVRGLTMQQRGGVVTQVSPLPLPAVTDFHQAAAEAERTVTHLHLTKDGEIARRVRDWQTRHPLTDGFALYDSARDMDNAAPETYAVAGPLERGVDLRVSIEPHKDPTGCYLLVEFESAIQDK